MTSITIGSGVNTIGTQAFTNCLELTDVYCYAENVPNMRLTDYLSISYTDAFYGSLIEYATLHVPTTSIDAYKAKEPWKNFKSIMGLDGTIVETTKCATPTIAIKDGKLTFSCETDGVKFKYDIQANGSTSGEGNILDITPSYTVKVFATKDGFEDSDVATETIKIIKGDVNDDGEVDIADAVKIVNLVVGKIDALSRPAKEVKDEKEPQ